MKHFILFLILSGLSFGQEAATGDYVFRKKVAVGYQSVNITPENGKVLGWTSGNLGNVTGGGGGGTWGSITGTLSAQTDLNTALGLKAPKADPTFTGTAAFGIINVEEIYPGLIESPSITSDLITGVINHANFTGPTVDRIFTLPDAAATLLYSGGSLGTPSGGTITNLTGTAAGATVGTVTSIGDLTGVVTSTNRATAIADAALSIAKTSGLQTQLDLKAPKANPTFTGTLTAEDVSANLIEAPAITSDLFTGPINHANFTGPTVDRNYALPDAAATLLYAGGPLGTPSSGTISGSFVSGGTLGATAGTNLTGTASALSIGGNAATATSAGSVTNLTLGGATTISTGGTIALGGYTLTVPATGTAALLGTANTFTAAQNITLSNNQAATTTITGLGVTTLPGIQFTNTTAASSGNQQYSPSVRWTGQGWKTTATAASQAVDFRAYVVPVQGTANPTATWTLESSINGAAFGTPLNYSSGGVLTLGTSGSTPNTSMYFGGQNYAISVSRGASNLDVGVGDSRYSFSVGNGAFTLAGRAIIGWDTTSTTIGGTTDTGIGRNAAGVVEVNNGTAGTYRDLKLRTLISDSTVRLKGYTVSTLPASPTAGDTAYVTDATLPTYNGTLTGGGAVVVPVFYNGSAWTSH